MCYPVPFQTQLTDKPRDSSDLVLKVSLKDEITFFSCSHGPSSRLQLLTSVSLFLL